VADPRERQSRDEKLENLIVNHSMIFMGLFEEAFSTLAEKMTAVLEDGTKAFADAVTQGLSTGSADNAVAGEAERPQGEIPPEVRTEIGSLFSAIREEMASQWPKNASLFKQYVSDPAFDKGIEIVEKYDFRRPRLTERLSDDVLASYVFLLKGGDKGLGAMFKELADWQSGLPKPPWAT
jgi:hypothetical protein